MLFLFLDKILTRLLISLTLNLEILEVSKDFSTSKNAIYFRIWNVN